MAPICLSISCYTLPSLLNKTASDSNPPFGVVIHPGQGVSTPPYFEWPQTLKVLILIPTVPHFAASYEVIMDIIGLERQVSFRRHSYGSYKAAGIY